IDKETGESIQIIPEVKAPPTYSKVFGETIVELAKTEPKIVAITAAMIEGTGLETFAEEFPERLFDVGIAEEHAVTFAAGLAKQGMIPVCAIYSTFLQRAFDQIIHDIALQDLHVVFCMDRAGLVGEDGATHHGVLDLAYLRPIQNMVIMAPKDEQELRDMMYSAIFYYDKGPVAIRYPRGKAVGVEVKNMTALPLGKGEILKSGKDIAILAVGKMVQESINAAEILIQDNIFAEVVNARFIKPLDYDLLDDIYNRFDKIITIEDGQMIGGFGSAVAEYFVTKNTKKVEVLIHGIPDKFIEHGKQAELLQDLKLDAEGIALTIKEFLNKDIPKNIFSRFFSRSFV
ncbi:MAG: transketolase C-terminal domain-containing protein, partial [FCB group bacterium]